jgi:hypothetical protein
VVVALEASHCRLTSYAEALGVSLLALYPTSLFLNEDDLHRKEACHASSALSPHHKPYTRRTGSLHPSYQAGIPHPSNKWKSRHPA